MSRARDESQSVDSSPGDTMIRRSLPSGRRLKVCVVGAGVAGLRAAKRLLDHDIDVTIVEARNRLGGRMGQSKVNGHLVDLGPNWIHGTSDNPISELARETNTQIHTWEERQITFDTDGSEVAKVDVAETSEAFWSIVSDAFKHSNKHFDDIPVEESLMDFVKIRATDRLRDSEEPEPDKIRKRQLLLHEALTWGGFVAGSTKRQSLKFFWLEETLEGENPFVAGTYEKILHAIGSPIAHADGVLRLNTMVEAIEYNQDNDHVVVKSTYDAKDTSEDYDEIIMTAPLGWLKRNKQTFRPSLPTRLDAAIDNIGYGNLDKVYISFPTAFWDTQATTTGAPITATRSNDIPNVTATTAPLHNKPDSSNSSSVLTDGHDRVGYPGFTHWYPPNYAKDTNPERFNQQAMNMAALPASCAHPTLLYYISGGCALYLSELQASTKDATELKEKLAAFFTPYFSLMPGYDKNNADCTPADILATNWAADEYAGYGSYSNFQVGLKEGDKDIEVMRHGMPERHIWLAGEHTAPFVALGTVTGAWWSGDAVATRILDAYGVHR